MNSLDVSIIIVTHNSSAVVGGSVAAIPNACANLTHEIIVVDAASTDATVDVLSGGPTVRVITCSHNRGFGFACNRGAGAARGEFLLFLNPDTLLDENSVATLTDVARSKKNSGAVVPRLRNADGSFQPSCRKFPTPLNILFSRGSLLGGLFGNGLYTLPELGNTTEIPAAAAAVMLIRKSDFHDIGGFDERFFMYMEDTDLCLRLSQRGLTNWFVPSAGAIHEWGRGSSSGQLPRLWHHHLSAWKYFLKHIPNGFTILLLPILLAGNLLVRLASLPFVARKQP